MSKDKLAIEGSRVEKELRSSLDDLLREGARRMLQSAIEVEVAEHIDRHKEIRDDAGHRLVVRNGSLPGRDILSGVGPLRVKQPRVHDRREGHRFTSNILPPFMRRVPSIDALIPALYLKGISTGDFTEALSAILGENAAGLSATNIVRLKAGWEEEYKGWSCRDLSGKRYVYMWADGIYFNVRLDPDRPCMLVLMGTLADGTKELVTVYDGHRESKDSWREVLGDLKARGLKSSPKLAVGDGALGFWAALEEIYPATRHQRCWVHKTANVLDKLPKRVQPHAKGMLHEIYLAPTKADAERACEAFLAHYGAKYPKACDCLRKDRSVLFTFYDFPAEHWIHIRTTNPIESTFATVRHRTRQTKGCGSRLATLMMVFKLARQAEKHWRRINAYKLIPKVIEGIKFVDGEMKEAA
jgi:transposase-like protein